MYREVVVVVWEEITVEFRGEDGIEDAAKAIEFRGEDDLEAGGDDGGGRKDCEAWYHTHSGFQSGSPMALTWRLSSLTFSTSSNSSFICWAKDQDRGAIVRGSWTPSIDEVVMSFMEQRRMDLSVEGEMFHILESPSHFADCASEDEERVHDEEVDEDDEVGREREDGQFAGLTVR